MQASRVYIFLLLIILVNAFSNNAFAKERKVNVATQVNLNAVADAKSVRLWIPCLMSDDNQDITDVDIKDNFTTVAIYRDGKYGFNLGYKITFREL